MKKLGIRLLRTLVAIGLFFLIQRVFAAEPLTPRIAPVGPSAPKIKEISSPNNEFFAAVSPDRKITTVYKIYRQGNIGRWEKFWSMNGCFQVAWLSNDGKYLVAGYEGLNFLPLDYAKDQVMLSFFECGELKSEVRLNQLITDFSRLQKTESGYHWGKYLGLNAAGYLVVETVEGKNVLFDVSTGKNVEFESEKAGKLPNWKIYSDIMRCYEFQYPANYLLNEVSSSIVLLKREDSGWLIETYFEDMADYPRQEFSPAKMTFEEFAFHVAKLACCTDGPSHRGYATDVVRMEPFTNSNKLDGIEFYLTEVSETYLEGSEEPEIEKTTKGPIYAFSISQPDELYRVLFLELRDEGEKLLQEKEILKKIVDTVRILK